MSVSHNAPIPEEHLPLHIQRDDVDLEDRAQCRDRGFLTPHDRAFLRGGAEEVGYEDPGGDKARQKWYQIRHRTLNGLQDLAYLLMFPDGQQKRLIEVARDLDSDAYSRLENGLLEWLSLFLTWGGRELYKEVVSTPIRVAEEQRHLRENNEYRETEVEFVIRYADPIPVEDLIRRKNDPDEALSGREFLALSGYQWQSAENDE